MGVPIGWFGRRWPRRREAGPPLRAGPRPSVRGVPTGLNGVPPRESPLPVHQAAPGLRSAARTSVSTAVPDSEAEHGCHSSLGDVDSGEITPALQSPFRPSSSLPRADPTAGSTDRERDLLAELLDANRRLTADAERRLRREVSDASEEPHAEENARPHQSDQVAPSEKPTSSRERPLPTAASLLELHERLNRDAQARLRRDQEGD
jgi:hypothetical protein